MQAQVCRKKREDAHNVYKLAKANQAELPVRAMCKTLKLSACGYYDWLDRGLSVRQRANTQLLRHIRQSHQESDQTYGMPRIRADLMDLGIVASRKRIASLMRIHQIKGKRDSSLRSG